MPSAAGDGGSRSRQDRRAHGAVDDLIEALKQPLTAIRAAAEILRDNPNLPAEMRDRLYAVVISDGDRLNRLIDNCFADADIDGDARRICLPVTAAGQRLD